MTVLGKQYYRLLKREHSHPTNEIYKLTCSLSFSSIIFPGGKMYYFDSFAGEVVETLLSETLKAIATESFWGEVLDLLR